ncbi:MAG: phenylalanine--tRNA ligase subunit beta, partial [Nitrospiraceae bacterium]|nr:phenylalanine--tRNA ligase subunit beta [Nitrospiraceae bacterium]
MRVPFGWLQEFINPGISVEKTAHLLTMSGLEVEALETDGEDVVLVINVTPNRADCLSILGIARELSVLTGAPLKLPAPPAGEAGPAGITVEIRNTELCRRYAGRVIRNARTGPGPEWMAKRLEACGLRPINNIVDVTNYVLLELGHPLHAFDLNTLKGGRIVVDTADKVYRKIKTLDGVERKLPAGALVIADAEGPVALAGIMGGASTEVEESTRDIFLEAAWFEPRNIRKTARALGLSTESSYRFERGADIGIIPLALERASLLIEDLAGGPGTVIRDGGVDVYPVKYAPPTIEVRTSRVNRILGAEIEEDEMLRILSRLGFAVNSSDGLIRTSPPSFRLDVEGEADVIEEVARIYGYDRIPAALPSSTLSGSGTVKSRSYRRPSAGTAWEVDTHWI